MSTSLLTGRGDQTAGQRRSRLLRMAAGATGASFVAEAIVSVFADSHIGYHSLSAVLNAALLVAAALLALAGRAAVGLGGVIGGWATAFMALLAAGGGITAVVVEGFSSVESPGAVEGISHTAVLASLLFLVPLGLGAKRVARVSGLVISASSACLVVMVLVGLDQPGMFLLPELGLGFGWVLLARRLSRGEAPHR